MAKNFVQPGAVMPVVAGGSIASGSVVISGLLLGVALAEASVGQTVSVALSGVYRLPKVSGAAIAQGETLVWDASAGAFDDNAATTAFGDMSGLSAVAFEAAAPGTTDLLVRLTGIPGTLNTSVG